MDRPTSNAQILAQIANVPESEILSKIPSVEAVLNERVLPTDAPLNIRIDPNNLDESFSGMIAIRFGRFVDQLNSLWWSVMLAEHENECMRQGSTRRPQETPEYAAWQTALNEYMWRPTVDSEKTETQTKQAYLHTPEYRFILKGKPELKPKSETPIEVRAMRAVENYRATHEPPKEPVKRESKPKTEAQMRKAEQNRRAYLARKAADEQG